MTYPMTMVLPVATEQKLVGSATLVAQRDDQLLFATALHLLGDAHKVQLVVPEHGGDCSRVQSYPLVSAPTSDAEVLASDPFGDLAILKIDGASGSFTIPDRIQEHTQVSVGSEVVVLGYPFAPLGSVLETWTPGYVTALGKRRVGPDFFVPELVLSNVAHPGSSGSAVVGKADGYLYGILRGSLAPPEVMKIGNIPIATDTSVTFATSGHLVDDLLKSVPSSG